MRDVPMYRVRPRRPSDYQGDSQRPGQAARRPRPNSQVEPPFPPPRKPQARRSPQQRVYALRLAMATLCAALVPFALANLGLAASIDTQLTEVGFDADRAQLIEFVLIAFVGALAMGIVLRWRTPVWLGALLYYVTVYWLPFMGHAQHPPLAPDGTPQVLVPGAFAATIATLLAVGILFSGAGAVLGEACGRVFVAPLTMLIRLALARTGLGHRFQLTRRTALAALTASMLSLVVITAFALIAGNVDSILNFGPTAAIYRPVRAAALQGVVQMGTYPSPALGGRLRQYMIYLPPSYATSPDQRYPVIYALHGFPGRFTNWFSAAHADMIANTLISARKMREAIIVSPDGNGTVYPISQWANSFDGHQQMEDAIVNDLVPYIDAHYRTLDDPAHRLIAGLSDGGYGAVNIALHHPNVFGAVLSLSGFYQASSTSPVFGHGAASNAYRLYNSPASYVTTPGGGQAAHILTFVLGVGTQDSYFYPRAQSFYKELHHLGVRVTLLQAPGGHSWQLWAAQFAQAMPLVEPPDGMTAPQAGSAG